MLTHDRWSRIEALYHDALSRAADERAAYLHEACADDESLRLEVASLLVSAGQARSWVGRRIGVYKIEAPLGSGGMGEVYRARDSKLGRDVAIKVLPPVFTLEPERRARFEREAQILASLNHPHIAQIHALDEAASTPFLVMELVEGETLAARLEKGALSLESALQIAIDIASALDQAHRAGIVHRDLKPANVMLTGSGAKLLDFGLARPIGTVVATRGASNVPTLAPITAEGTILGTVQYMAPEQLEGKEADARTDIFALGALIYEMATGKKAFEGESQADLIAAILDRDPAPIATIQPLAPAALDRVVRACLAKAPDERWQSAADLKRELVWTADHVGDTPAARHQRGWRRRAWIALAIAVALSAVAAGGWLMGRAAYQRPPRIVRSSIGPPVGQKVRFETMMPSFALSPDGSRIALAVVDGSEQTRLYLRALDRSDAMLVPGTDGAMSPFFSPDGQWIGFLAGGKLRKISVRGGAPVVICDKLMGDMRGATWTDDNRIVFAPGTSSGLWQVSANGGTPTVFVKPDPSLQEKSIRWPSALPGGEAVLATVATASMTSFDEARIEVVSLDTGARRRLVDGGTYAQYASTGHVIYARAGSLVAVPFDLTQLAVTGTPASVVDRAATGPLSGDGNFAMSNDGTLVYAAGPAIVPQRQLAWVSRDGHVQTISDDRRPFGGIRVSPDGGRLAVHVQGASDQIWIYNLGRSTFTRLTFAWDNLNPLWTPDGTRVAFLSIRPSHFGLFMQPADGTSEAVGLVTDAVAASPGSFTRDGRLLIYTGHGPTTGWDLWTVRTDVADTPRVFLQTPFAEFRPRLSPDERWVAYTSNDSGRNEIFIRHFPDGGAKRQVSTDGGDEAIWAPDGRTIFYKNGEQMMAVDVAVPSDDRSVRPRMLFKAPFVATNGMGPNFDLAPDGRFVFSVPVPPEVPSDLTLVQNWFAELTRAVPR